MKKADVICERKIDFDKTGIKGKRNNQLDFLIHSLNFLKNQYEIKSVRGNDIESVLPETAQLNCSLSKMNQYAEIEWKIIDVSAVENFGLNTNPKLSKLNRIRKVTDGSFHGRNNSHFF